VVSSHYEFVHRDHLGSVDQITCMPITTPGWCTNNQLLTDSRVSFDPFGGRRATNWSSDLGATGMTTVLANEDVRYARGFTDHEHLNRTGFIHMNGRVYDPRIGRFTSPDPVVQAPTFSQSWNRYAYVFNNPLSWTDPSGFVPFWRAGDPDPEEEGREAPDCDSVDEGCVWAKRDAKLA